MEEEKVLKLIFDGFIFFFWKSDSLEWDEYLLVVGFGENGFLFVVKERIKVVGFRGLFVF